MCKTCLDVGVFRIGGDYKDAEGRDVVRQQVCECPAGERYREAYPEVFGEV